MLRKRLTNEVAVGIGEGGAGRCAALKALAFQSGAHGVRMQPQLGGNGANLPVLAMKQASNIGLLFGSDHSFSRHLQSRLRNFPWRPQKRQTSKARVDRNRKGAKLVFIK
jgi:hypothetical protein